MKNKKYYMFEGGVYHYDRLLTAKWATGTYAVSEKQARNNILYQYKKKFKLMQNVQLKLDGKIIERG